MKPTMKEKANSKHHLYKSCYPLLFCWFP